MGRYSREEFVRKGEEAWSCWSLGERAVNLGVLCESVGAGLTDCLVRGLRPGTSYVQG